MKIVSIPLFAFSALIMLLLNVPVCPLDFNNPIYVTKGSTVSVDTSALFGITADPKYSFSTDEPLKSHIARQFQVIEENSLDSTI